jgi:hypothetical protein
MATSMATRQRRAARAPRAPALEEASARSLLCVAPEGAPRAAPESRSNLGALRSVPRPSKRWRDTQRDTAFSVPRPRATPERGPAAAKTTVLAAVLIRVLGISLRRRNRGGVVSARTLRRTRMALPAQASRPACWVLGDAVGRPEPTGGPKWDRTERAFWRRVRWWWLECDETRCDDSGLW